MKTYFITGATGAIGACIVPMLLSERDTRVRLLIRARDEKHLSERLERLLYFWGYNSESNPRQRIKACRGDISLPSMGMNPKEYQTASEECTHVIHCAGNVRMNLSLKEARKSSVDSARNVAAFARACQVNGNLEKVEFVSTVGVGGRMSGLVPEDWIEAGRSFHNTYEEAKAEAEVFIRQQIERGLPATVHRPSMVVGHSGTGKIIHFQIFYHICELLSGRRTLGVLPKMERARLDIIPVDYVASTIIWSSDQKSTVGNVLHSCSGPGNAVSIDELRHRIRSTFDSHGERLPLPVVIPLPFFQAVLPLVGLFVSPQARRSLRALPFLLDYLAEEQCFENVNTRRMTREGGIELPAVDDYLNKVLEHYLEVTRL